MHRSRCGRGFTLLELLSCLALMALIACLALPPMQRWQDNRRLEMATRQLGADLRFAREQALVGRQTVRVGFRSFGLHSACYVVYRGAAGACRCLEGDPGRSACEGDAAALLSTSLPPSGRLRFVANVETMSFDPLHGTSTPAATLQLASPGGPALRQVVNLLGRVRTCSPQGGMAGYGVC